MTYLIKTGLLVDSDIGADFSLSTSTIRVGDSVTLISSIFITGDGLGLAVEVVVSAPNLNEYYY